MLLSEAMERWTMRNKIRDIRNKLRRQHTHKEQRVNPISAPTSRRHTFSGFANGAGSAKRSQERMLSGKQRFVSKAKKFLTQT